MINAKGTVRIYHNPTQGWLVDTPIALSATELQNAINYHKKSVLECIRFKRSERKEELMTILRKLSVQTIKQNLVNEYPWQKEKNLFIDRELI